MGSIGRFLFISVCFYRLLSRRDFLLITGEGRGEGFLKSLNLVLVGEQEVDVVIGIHETILLVGVDVEVFAVASGEVGHRLVGHIHLHLCLRIGCDAVEEFLLELLADNDGQHEAVEEVIAMNISERTGDDHSHPVAGNGPCGMFTRGTRTPVLTAHDDFVYTLARCFGILRLVHHEVLHWVAVSIEAKVVHEGIAKELWVTCRARQVAGRNDEVGIAVVNLNRDAG